MVVVDLWICNLVFGTMLKKIATSQMNAAKGILTACALLAARALAIDSDQGIRIVPPAQAAARADSTHELMCDRSFRCAQSYGLCRQTARAEYARSPGAYPTFDTAAAGASAGDAIVLEMCLPREALIPGAFPQPSPAHLAWHNSWTPGWRVDQHRAQLEHNRRAAETRDALRGWLNASFAAARFHSNFSASLVQETPVCWWWTQQPPDGDCLACIRSACIRTSEPFQSSHCCHMSGQLVVHALAHCCPYTDAFWPYY